MCSFISNKILKLFKLLLKNKLFSFLPSNISSLSINFVFLSGSLALVHSELVFTVPQLPQQSVNVMRI